MPNGLKWLAILKLQVGFEVTAVTSSLTSEVRLLLE